MFYGWPAANQQPIPRAGEDEFGVMGFAPRQDELGVFKRDSIHKITGFGESSFNRSIVKEGIGCIAPESIVTIDDVTYFLSKYGVYTWGAGGVENISSERVYSWFTTSTTFQRASLMDAVGVFNQEDNTYELLLPATGGSALNRWISYDLEERVWLGPHLTSEFTPNYIAALDDADDLSVRVIGGTDGFLYKPQSTRTDGTSTGVALDIDTIFHSANTPDILKQWLEMSLISKVQPAGTLTITPKVGGLDASAGSAISANMTLGRQRIRRLWAGRFLKLNFTRSTARKDAEIYGFEVPWFELGRR